MVDFDGVINLDLATVLVQVGPHLAGIDANGQRPIGGVVHGEMPLAQLEHHLRIDHAHAHERDAVGLDLEGGQGPLQSGELALLITERIALVAAVHKPPLGDQLNGLRLGVLVGLGALDGDDDAFIHKRFTSIRFQNALRGLLYTT